ncbi:hypothetical protein OH749_31445 (plasmid) [Streptomyces albidoflavus]|uniref:hypothetical protein n=1 Tax=Streptomyces albidoflavus TaxID=1886 RepID=UPI002F940F0C|nr:hypothetical protein OH749_31445 [Streptomyces albidoflavus]
MTHPAPPLHLREITRRILARYIAVPRHRTWAVDAYDEEQHTLSAWSAGIALGTWATDPYLPEWGSSLAYHLTAHTMATVATHRYIVTASLDREHAAISVMALRGRIHGRLAPSEEPVVQALSRRAGHLPLPAGPLVYAVIGLPTPGPLPPPQSEPG